MAVRDRKLGPYFTRQYIPSFNLHGNYRDPTQKAGSVNLNWVSVAFHPQPPELHAGVLSRGIKQVKCYTTHAHYTRNFLGNYCDPTYEFKFTTIRNAQLELTRAEDDLRGFIKNMGKKHRCEMVWVPNRHFTTLTLLQLVNLAVWVRVHLLSDYRIVERPVHMLPTKQGIFKRTLMVIAMLKNFCSRRYTDIITKKSIGHSKYEWFAANYALMLAGLGLSGNRLYQIFSRWKNCDQRLAYDPHAWWACLNPYDSWVRRYPTETLFDNEMIIRPTMASRYMKHKLGKDAERYVIDNMTPEALQVHQQECYNHFVGFEARIIRLMDYLDTHPMVNNRIASLMPGQDRFEVDMATTNTEHQFMEEINNENELIDVIIDISGREPIHRDAFNIQDIPLPRDDIQAAEQRNSPLVLEELDRHTRGSMEWWAILYDKITVYYESRGQLQNFNRPLSYIEAGMANGSIPVATVRQLLSLFNIRVQQNQRRMDHYLVLLQGRFE